MNTYQVRSVRGFTLVELLVVMAIIGILSAIVYASMFEARAKSRDTARVSDLKQIELALALYREAEGDYPTANELFSGGALDTFLPTIPTDPLDGSNYTYSSSGSGFDLITTLETGTNRACYVKSRSQAVPSAPSGVSDFFECGNF